MSSRVNRDLPGFSRTKTPPPGSGVGNLVFLNPLVASAALHENDGMGSDQRVFEGKLPRQDPDLEIEGQARRLIERTHAAGGGCELVQLRHGRAEVTDAGDGVQIIQEQPGAADGVVNGLGGAGLATQALFLLLPIGPDQPLHPCCIVRSAVGAGRKRGR